MSNRTEQSFGIIPLQEIQSQWRVFLIQHRNGLHWGFPKGHREGEESGKDAAIRELLEETGLTVAQVLTEKPIEEKYQCVKHNEKIDKTVFYYPAVVQGVAELQYDEIAMGNWLALSEAKSLITFEESKRVLAQVEGLLEGRGKS